jgi:hypothetical protein
MNLPATHRSGFVNAGGIQENHQPACGYVFRHLRCQLLTGNDLHLGVIVKLPFQLARDVNAYSIVAA